MDDVLVVGEALVDIVRQQDGQVAEHPGGSPANVALGLGRLGHQVDCSPGSVTTRADDSMAEPVWSPPGSTWLEATQTADATSTATAILDRAGCGHLRLRDRLAAPRIRQLPRAPG